MADAETSNQDMNTTNGQTAPPAPPAAAPAPAAKRAAPRPAGEGRKTESEIGKILAALAEPFEVEDIKWLPGATNREKTRAIAMAYADPRAYLDRLNEVVGPQGWTSSSSTATIGGFMKKVGWGNDAKFEPAAKILVTVRVTIDGIGTHEDVGEAAADDENGYTSAYAQAMKRACVPFGLGRYLYSLPKDVWCAYDKDKRAFSETPSLPSWAVPQKYCTDGCNKAITPQTVSGQTWTVTALVARSKQMYDGKQLCAECMKAEAVRRKAAAGTSVGASRPQ